jgi:ribosomal protein L37E
MMGYYGKPALTCPNCGAKDWQDKKDHECEKCGFKRVESKELEAIQLIYCSGCGCTLSDWCQSHSTTQQNEVKW